VAERWQVGDRLVVDVERMAYGPHAIARHEGFVLFVRGATPGERVEVMVRERRRNHAFADVVRIERASTRRRQPACPVAGQCGGCPWQHLSYDLQLEAKREIVADHLARIAGLQVVVAPVVSSPRVFGYRRRIKLRTDAKRLGFYAGGTHDLVQIAHCALAESEADAAIAAAQALVEQLTCNLRRLEIIVRTVAGGGTILVGEIEGRWPAGDEERARTWLERNPDCVGMVLHGKGWERRWGETTIAVEPDHNLSLEVDAAGFSQVNTLGNQRLVATVLRLLGELSGVSVLEAYAGAGNFSAPIVMRGARVLAVEHSLVSCGSAQRNAAAFADRWVVKAGRVREVLDRLANSRIHFDALLLDPPRSGAADAIPAILRLRPPRIVYVSCDPATLARDLKGLSGEYRVTAVQPVDMFPHTYHVETVVRCDRLP
jgi:23S rRNA (uracil1939-C5)-methyltransferase